MENLRLYNENRSLVKEKNFLIDQIKFMQNLIKSNTLNFKNSDDIEKNITHPKMSSLIENKNEEIRNISLNGSRQKSFGRVFSICLICILSIAYVSFNPVDNNESISFSSDSSISLNDDSEKIKINKNYFDFDFDFIGFIIKSLIVMITALIIINFSSIMTSVKYFFFKDHKKKM